MTPDAIIDLALLCESAEGVMVEYGSVELACAVARTVVAHPAVVPLLSSYEPLHDTLGTLERNGRAALAALLRVVLGG